MNEAKTRLNFLEIRLHRLMVRDRDNEGVQRKITREIRRLKDQINVE